MRTHRPPTFFSPHASGFNVLLASSRYVSAGSLTVAGDPPQNGHGTDPVRMILSIDICPQYADTTPTATEDLP